MYSIAVLLSLSSQVGSERAPDRAGPSRVVSVGGSVTEIVFELGLQERLVGRDSTSLYPQEALHLPSVGYMRALSAEGVLSMQPDVILVLEGSGPPEVLSVLKEAGLRYVSIPAKPYNRQGLRAKILAVGEALGRRDAANELAESTDRAIERAIAERPARSHPIRAMFVLSTRGGQILAAGADTGAAGIIELAGGENVFSFPGYRPVSTEAVLIANPEVIVRMESGAHGPGSDGMSDDALLAMPAIAKTRAGQLKAVVRVDGPLALGFGPRTAEAVRALARTMNAVAMRSPAAQVQP